MTNGVPLLLSIAFGLGVWLLYEGLTDPRPPAPPGRRLRRVEEFLRRAGLDVSPREFMLFSLGSGLAAGAVAQLVLGWVLPSLLAGAAGAGAPLGYYLRRHDRRRAAVQAALVEGLGQLRDAIRAGLAVGEALGGLAESGPEALRPELARLVRDMRLVGLERALAETRERLADPLFDMTAGALALNEAVGSRNVSSVLDRLAHAARGQLAAQEELRAQQAKNVLSARIVAAVPLVALVAIRALNPGYLAVFDTAAGQLILAGCAASVALGYAAMLWLVRLPGEPRVLGAPEEGAP